MREPSWLQFQQSVQHLPQPAQEKKGLFVEKQHVSSVSIGCSSKPAHPESRSTREEAVSFVDELHASAEERGCASRIS